MIVWESAENQQLPCKVFRFFSQRMLKVASHFRVSHSRALVFTIGHREFNYFKTCWLNRYIHAFLKNKQWTYCNLVCSIVSQSVLLIM